MTIKHPQYKLFKCSKLNRRPPKKNIDTTPPPPHQTKSKAPQVHPYNKVFGKLLDADKWSALPTSS